MAKKPCYARPTPRSWLLKQGSMGDISRLIGGPNVYLPFLNLSLCIKVFHREQVVLRQRQIKIKITK